MRNRTDCFGRNHWLVQILLQQRERAVPTSLAGPSLGALGASQRDCCEHAFAVSADPRNRNRNRRMVMYRLIRGIHDDLFRVKRPDGAGTAKRSRLRYRFACQHGTLRQAPTIRIQGMGFALLSRVSN